MKNKLSRTKITHLFKIAKRILRHPAMDILCAPIAAEQTLGNLIVVTSRRVGNAVTRNKIRRQIKAIFHEQNLLTRGYDCIIITKQTIIKLSFKELEELLEQTFNNIRNSQ